MMSLNIKKEFSTILILYFFSINSYSQTKIDGLVVDLKNKPIPFVTVQLVEKETNFTTSYTQSNEKGAFSLKAKKANIKYYLKFRLLGYKPKNIDLTDLKKTTVTLEELTEELKEVVITVNQKELSVNNDTLTYKLNKILDSTEVNLKDIVEKLPGLTIDENKKILFLGKKIEKVTIEGNDFFGRKHEMATENLSADAIRGIKILKNYKDFADISSQKTGKIVLNITLKKNYKDRIVGNIDAKSGALEKHQIHSNLFKFINKGNFALVSEANNIGKEAINMIDYIEMSGGIRNFSISNRNDGTGAIEVDHSKTPRFVFVNKNVDKRTTLFNSINFTNTFSKKTRLTGYINFDRTKINELTANTKIFAGENTLQINEENIQESLSYLGNSYVTLSHKRNKDEIISYNLKFNPLKDHEIKEISQNFQLNKTKKNNILSLGQNILYKKNLTKLFNISINLFSDIKNQKNIINYEANQEILGTEKQNIINKEKNNTNNLAISIANFMDLGYSTKLKTEISYDRNLNKSSLKSNFENFSFQINNNNDKFSIYNKIKYYFTSKLSSEFGLQYTNNNLKINNLQKTQHWVLPQVLISYRFKNNKKISLNFIQNNRNLNSNEMNLTQQVIDYNTVINPNKDIFTPIKNTMIGFNYNSINYDKNSTFSILNSYIITEDDINYNTIIKNNHIIQEYRRSPSRTFNSEFTYNSSIKKVKLKYKLSGSYANTTSKSFLNNIENLSNSESYSVKLVFNSAKKRKFIKSRLKIYFDKNVNKNTFSEFNYDALKLTFIPEIYGGFNNVLWKLNYKYTQIQTNIQNQEIQALNFSLQWQFQKNLELFFSGENIFNLNNNPLISYTNNKSFTQFTRLEQLKGNLLVGMRFHF